MILIVSCADKASIKINKSVNDDSLNYRGPIIDMHVHAYNEVNPLFGRAMENPLTGKVYMGAKSVQIHQQETLAKFKQHNIVKAMVSEYPEAWYQTSPSTVLIGKGQGFSIEHLRSLHQQGRLHVLGEIAPNYDGLMATDDSLTAYYDLAVELDIPIGLHLFPGGPPGGAYFAYPKTRARLGKPLQLEEILFARPDIKIYIMHAGWPFLDEMKALMYAHLQVYVDIGAISWGLPRKEFYHFLQGLVDAGFGQRIMFGSDQMQWPTTISEAIEAVNSASFLTRQQKADIFYNNAARFLELPADEINRHKKL